ncbi:hypothetical protein [Arthrobacter caoxuetaonis]|uniref:Uncharacterized protein n=1 Tax=Arthrobacter caoxuetaonis TaxID=2886935 RepID=A0A9X1MI70_9MICC|nr:hypothetical protein [Arthrobacter caoxuetaonis]MCC3299377.1 hypothetical protein [Arthrobacter caoxuetaonis]USQ59130.1 hypothetical protein NF551_18665 [Arthrobacter caoxuetaonis]
MAAKQTERSMLNALLERYTDIRRGTLTDRWIRAEHVQSGLGYRDGARAADFVAADRHSSTMALHGHEVKVSRADWLNELKDPTKADAVKRYMDFWWLVVPDPGIVKDGELPADWGLMVLKDGKLRAKKTAPRLDPAPVPLDFTIALMTAAARTGQREVLHRDAPTVHLHRGYSCGLCGAPAPNTRSPGQHGSLKPPEGHHERRTVITSAHHLDHWGRAHSHRNRRSCLRTRHRPPKQSAEARSWILHGRAVDFFSAPAAVGGFGSIRKHLGGSRRRRHEQRWKPAMTARHPQFPCPAAHRWA